MRVMSDYNIREYRRRAVDDLRDYFDNASQDEYEIKNAITDIAQSLTPAMNETALLLAAHNLSDVGARWVETGGGVVSPAEVARVAIADYLEDAMRDALEEWRLEATDEEEQPDE